jgi:DNA-binding NarL/FixJ family response regulator
MKADGAARGARDLREPSKRHTAVAVAAGQCVAAVVDDVPIFRLGLESALKQGGYRIIPVSSLEHRVDDQTPVLLVSMRSENSKALLGRYGRLAPVPVRCVLIAILGTPSAEEFRDALRLGCAGVAAQDATPQELLASIDAAVQGRIIIPAGYLDASHVVETTGVVGTGAAASREDIRLLTLLAEGRPVEGIAKELRQGKRTIEKDLNRLYRLLGVQNRSQAVSAAYRAGLLR